MDADPGRGIGPLRLEVLGGGHHHDAFHGPGVQQLMGDAQREGRLARPGGGHAQEVAGLGGRVQLKGGHLPGPETLRGAPGGALRERGGEVFERGGSHTAPKRTPGPRHPCAATAPEPPTR